MSKLDEAFLKAYAKVRETGLKQMVETPVAPHPEASAEVLQEDDTDLLLRADDGVVNVASFIARTSNGRTRGMAKRPPGGVAEGVAPHQPPTPDFGTEPSDGVEKIQIIDGYHAPQGPHFQPISLDLAALDVYAAVATSVRQADEDLAWWEPTTLVVEDSYGQSSVRAGRASAEVETRATVEQLAKPSSFPDSASISAKLRIHQLHDSDGRATEAVAEHIEDRVLEEATPHSAEADVELTGATADERVFVRADMPHQPLAESPKDAEQGAVHHSEFVAAWEVDRFEFEDIVWELSAEASPLWQAAEQLEIACREGLKVLAITSPGRGQGRSTLAITLARMLSATGLNVALLDGDIDRPTLADKMRLEIRLGWGDAVRTGLSVEEVAVQSVEDGFTVLPSATPDATKAQRPAAEATGVMLGRLREAFDLVVIDTANVNVVGGWIPGADDRQIDAALVIQDLRTEDPDAMQACLRRLQKIGIANIGLVENFANA